MPAHSSVSEGAGAPAEDPFEGSPYRSLGRLASGGMGEVFRVVHRELGRELVAKLLHPWLAGEPRVVDRVRIEAQSLGRLDHPHIVSIRGFGAARDGRPFIVMEHLRGRALSAEIKARGPLPLEEAVAITGQVLSALSAAHDIGIVHRDVKPDNVFLCERPDGKPFAKVLDFGIARVMPGASPGSPMPLALPTETGVVVGTPRFVSPEGAVGQRVDQRADVYAAALVLYVMIAGRGPFDHVSGHANVLSAHVVEEPAPPSKWAGSSVSPALDAAVMKALKKEPADRYQTAAEFARALRSAAGTKIVPVGWGLHTTAAPGIAFRSEPPSALAPAPLPVTSPSLVDGSGPPRRVMAIVFVVILLVTALCVATLVGLVGGKSP